MKILLDQNISYRLVGLLSGHFAAVTHVKHEGPTDASDLEIRSYAN